MTLRVASIVASHTAGGIGRVCEYAAESLAGQEPWEVSIVGLHDPAQTRRDADTGLNVISLGLTENHPASFLQWLEKNPQDVIITSDVSLIEAAFPYIPQSTAHIVQIHDSMKRYRQVAVRHQAFIDGVITVADHVLARLAPDLDGAHFTGLSRSIHNGVSFPELLARVSQPDTLRLLFVGRMDAIKGIFDLPPLLTQLSQLNIPVELGIVGGESEQLRKSFEQAGQAEKVRWYGKIPHEDCFDVAAISDVFLMTSRLEAFGMVTIESMGMGCVPIAYDLPTGSREIIEDGKNGFLVRSGDIRGFTELIANLHRNREYLAQLGTAAAERARTHFNATTMGQELGQLIRDVLENRKQHLPQRKSGSPSVADGNNTFSFYQIVPDPVRVYARKTICDYPTLANWVFGR